MEHDCYKEGKNSGESLVDERISEDVVTKEFVTKHKKEGPNMNLILELIKNPNMNAPKKVTNSMMIHVYNKVTDTRNNLGFKPNNVEINMEEVENNDELNIEEKKRKFSARFEGGESHVATRKGEYVNPQTILPTSDAFLKEGATVEKAHDTHFLSAGPGSQAWREE